MTPTIGRIVHYHTTNEAVAALVVGTFNSPPDMVDLATFPRSGGLITRHSVREGTAPGCWSWPALVPSGTAIREGG